MQDSEWILVCESASHPFWSRDGRRLFYLPTFPNFDVRSRVLARGFDTSTFVFRNLEGEVTKQSSEIV